MVTALIVDDHEVFRHGLKQILSEEFGELTCGEAGDAEEMLALLEKRGWDIVILDIGIPGKNGIEVLKQIRRTHPRLRILVLSMYSEDQYAARALGLGALGYVTKGQPRAELVSAIRKVMAGETHISVPSRGKKDATARGSLHHEVLSQRELKVMLALAAGKRLTDIAAEMNLSIKTVSTYKRRILDKMNLKVNADLTRYAIQHGLL